MTRYGDYGLCGVYRGIVLGPSESPHKGLTGLLCGHGNETAPPHLPVPLRTATYTHSRHPPEESTEALGSRGADSRGARGNLLGGARNLGGGYSGQYNSQNSLRQEPNVCILLHVNHSFVCFFLT